MKKKVPSSATWHHSSLRFFMCLSVLIFVLALLGIQYNHRVLLQQVQATPKIAFLFLVRQDLPLDFLWDSFFKNVDAAKFSIYIHSKPGFMFNDLTTRSEFFYDRQLKESVQVEWGESSMIQAEKLLLKAALHHPANQRFVLLSDSCIPLYNFSYTYNYLMSSTQSFVDSFVSVGDGRYNPKMSPLIPKNIWRKGSQWFTLVRKHAQLVADDSIVFTIFSKLCKKLLKNSNCIPDEHYVPTLLTMSGCEDELERRTLTYTSWDQKSWHPVTFDYADVGSERIQDIKGTKQVYHESEGKSKRERCRTNMTEAPCFLFARKFTARAALRLLMIHGFIGRFK